MLWQADTSVKMKNLLAGILKTDEITIGGSVQNPAELDLYSDVDMKILLRGSTPININAVLDVITAEFSPVFGYEVISHSRKDAVRLCLENGMRFDLVFRYPSDKEPKPADGSFLQKVNAVVNSFWFYASMILVKLGRKEHLIAAHLALEMCQMLIVIQMLMRDNQKGANIHRFGDSEEIPFLRSPIRVSAPFNLGCDTADEILAMLLSAAAEMDKLVFQLGYPPKSGVLNALIIYFLECKKC